MTINLGINDYKWYNKQAQDLRCSQPERFLYKPIFIIYAAVVVGEFSQIAENKIKGSILSFPKKVIFTDESQELALCYSVCTYMHPGAREWWAGENDSSYKLEMIYEE